MKPRTLLLIVLFFGQLGCSSRYDPSKCPGNPFPDAHELLSLPSFSRLAYFAGKPNEKSPVDWEIWADAKFEFSVCLKYHYAKADPQTRDCPQAVTLEIRVPASPESRTMGESFLGHFEKRLNADLGVLQSSFSQSVVAFQPGKPQLSEMNFLIGEVSSIHHVNRGDFLIVGIYRKGYYDAFLRLP